MPYIKQENREELDLHLAPLADVLKKRCDHTNEPAGDLNYAVSYLTDALLGGRVNYAMINKLIGALECAKMELYRRVAAPYEDVKIAENGDVYNAPI